PTSRSSDPEKHPPAFQGRSRSPSTYVQANSPGDSARHTSTTVRERQPRFDPACARFASRSLHESRDEIRRAPLSDSTHATSPSLRPATRPRQQPAHQDSPPNFVKPQPIDPTTVRSPDPRSANDRTTASAGDPAHRRRTA